MHQRLEIWHIWEMFEKRFDYYEKMYYALLILLVVSLLTACNSAKNLDTSQDLPKGDAEVREDLALGKQAAESISGVSATYMDSVMNFKDLEKKSGYIVRGTVLSTEMVSPFAQKSEIKIEAVYKGSVPDIAYLYQLAGDNNVQKGSEYILFLNPQNSDEPNSGEYYTAAEE